MAALLNLIYDFLMKVGAFLGIVVRHEHKIVKREIQAAELNPAQQKQVYEARGALVKEVMKLERNSVQIRRELVASALKIVSGD